MMLQAERPHRLNLCMEIFGRWARCSIDHQESLNGDMRMRIDVRHFETVECGQVLFKSICAPKAV